jgi:hypothetical protein
VATTTNRYDTHMTQTYTGCSGFTEDVAQSIGFPTGSHWVRDQETMQRSIAEAKRSDFGWSNDQRTHSGGWKNGKTPPNTADSSVLTACAQVDTCLPGAA